MVSGLEKLFSGLESAEGVVGSVELVRLSPRDDDDGEDEAAALDFAASNASALSWYSTS